MVDTVGLRHQISRRDAAQFILPVNHSKRLSIGYVSLILILMELLFLKYSIPKIGSQVSLVVTYYSQCLILVVLTVFVSAILERLSHPTHPLLDFPPPESMKTILTGPLAVVLCVSTHASKVGMSGHSAEDGDVLTEAKSPSYSHEWLLIAKVVDRISLILFTGIFVFSLIGYISPVK
ncbi:hypothetical protein Avbf_10383 [Armadillidium vulgare]|nr:hypothetical protein Avbf_10383 [Armadillidium vulgare]